MIRLEIGFLGQLHAPRYLQVTDVSEAGAELRSVDILCTWCGDQTRQVIHPSLPPTTIYIQLVRHHLWCMYIRDRMGISTNIIQMSCKMVHLK